MTLIFLQLKLITTILVWALALNSTKWFEWRAVEKNCTTLEAGREGLEDLASHEEMRNHWTIDRTGLEAKELINVTRELEYFQNSTLRLISFRKESEDCESQVVPLPYPSHYIFSYPNP